MSVDQVPVTVVSGENREAVARTARRVCEALDGRQIAVVGARLPGGPWGLGVELDARISYRTPGCLCCAYRSDLMDVLGELAVGVGRPEWIIVLEDPGADPLLVVQTFLADPSLRQRVLLDGLVVSVDAPTVSTRLSSAHELGAGSAGGNPTVATWSSTIVFDGLDLLTSRGKSTVIRAVHEAAPLANVATDGSLAVAVGRKVLDPYGAHELLGNAMQSGGPVIEFRSALDPKRAHEALQALLDAHSGQLPMVLASLSFVGRPGRLVVHGARAYVENEWLYDAPTDGVSRVLVVGEGVDRGALRRQIALVRS